jgi:predicted DNA binding CopG/RHH family protein
MPSQQLELKSDITNLFKDLESIAKDTKVNAPHVPKIEQADITELFSGLNEAHEEAKIEVELRLSLEEKNELDIITNLADTFSEITKPEENPKPVDESVNIQALEELFSTITEPNSDDIVVDEIKVDTISEEPTSVEKTASMIDKAIVHLDSLEGKTEITEEVNQIATLRKEFDNFRSLIAQQIASTQMSGAGGGEVRLEFMDDVDRDSVKVDGKFLKYQASTNKFVGADAGDTITNEQLQDVVGAMISSNTESGITVTYEDSDGTLDFVVGTLNQDTTGNAATATVLETARTIGGVSFNGSANINLPGVNTSGNQDTTGNAATATTLETARTIHGVSFDGSANIDLSEVIQDTVGAMFSSNTETDIAVTYQDSDGTIDLVVSGISGNAGTATALETARTIAGVSFDGTANITIASTDLSDTSSIALLTSSQTLTNKTLTSPVINTGLSGTAFLDEDDMSSNSATKVASQQSIKAFVDAVESRTRAFAIAIGAGL